MVNVKLRESTGALPAPGEDGKYTIRLIASDVQGSTGFYSREVIERDGPNAFPRLTKIYADHPTMEERENQPERSINKIAGKIISTPYMKEDGLYADVQFGRKYRDAIEDYHDILGMSIHASGSIEESEDESGTIVRVVKEISPSPMNSVDLVTVAGAGGAIVQALTESFREVEADDKPEAPASGNETERIVQMDEKDIKAIADALAETFKPLFEKVDTLVESLKAEAPADEDNEPDLAAVTEAAVEAGLPKSARARVIESVRNGGDAEKAIEAEKGYIAEVLAESKTDDGEDEGTGRIRESGNGSWDDKLSSLSIFGGSN